MYLKEETKRNIERTVGLPFEKIQTLTTEEEITHVQQCTGKTLQYPKFVDWRFIAIGEPLITMGRCRTMEDVDRYFDKLLFPQSLLWTVKKMFYRKEK
ncbi:MAG: hypothetical protein IJ419_07295 [Agathobacter sp.]|nr:hypothetical protein [Agathobacter sp.]